MPSWTEQHAKFIGRIIFADLLEYPLPKYKNFIKDTEQSLPAVKFKLLSRAKVSQKAKSAVIAREPRRGDRSNLNTGSQQAPQVSSNIVAEIVKSGKDFSIRYTDESFNRIYLLNKKFFDKKARTGAVPILHRDEIGQRIRSAPATLDSEAYLTWLFRARRVNSRNALTHWILKGIIEHQREYLKNGDPIDLVPFSQVELTEWINKNSRSAFETRYEIRFTRCDNTWVSRLVNGISIITPQGEEKLLKWFFQTRKDINKRLIKQLLDKENEDIESGRLKKPLTDNRIRAKLESEYGVKISRHSVGHCRKDMGIPPAKRRLSGYKYPPLSANFSILYSLTIEAVTKYAPEKSGVYELSTKRDTLHASLSAIAPEGAEAERTTVFYLGSSRNIRKRLREHLGKNSKNGQIRNFFKKYECSFRYIQLSGGWQQEEKRLYGLFTSTYGAPPKCNKVRP